MTVARLLSLGAFVLVSFASAAEPPSRPELPECLRGLAGAGKPVRLFVRIAPLGPDAPREDIPYLTQVLADRPRIGAVLRRRGTNIDEVYPETDFMKLTVTPKAL